MKEIFFSTFGGKLSITATLTTIKVKKIKYYEEKYKLWKLLSERLNKIINQVSLKL